MTGWRIGAARWINATDVRTAAPPPPLSAPPLPAAQAPGSPASLLPVCRAVWGPSRGFPETQPLPEVPFPAATLPPPPSPNPVLALPANASASDSLIGAEGKAEAGRACGGLRGRGPECAWAEGGILRFAGRQQACGEGVPEEAG